MRPTKPDAESCQCPEPVLVRNQRDAWSRMCQQCLGNLVWRGAKLLVQGCERNPDDFLETTMTKPTSEPEQSAESPTSYRIGWLDSSRMFSGVHRTVDNGKTTVCKHPAQENHLSRRWVLAVVPTTIRGRKRYCRRCFNDEPRKSIPWLPACLENPDTQANLAA